MTVWGQKLITPNDELTDGRTAWEAIDELALEGKASYEYDSGRNNVSYQTLYNPNFVPMYICAVLPLLGMFFIYFWKKTETEGSVLRLIGLFATGVLYALELFSLYRANSANGFVGLIATFVLSVLFFNKKLIKMAEPVVAIVLIFGIITAATPQSWVPQWRQVENDLKLIWSVVHGDSSVRRDYIVAGSEEIRADGEQTFDKKPASVKPFINYIETGTDEVTMCINGNPFTVKVFDDGNIAFYDDSDSFVEPRIYDAEDMIFEFVDARFHDYVSFTYFLTEDNRSIVVRLTTPGKDWDFRFDMHDRGVYFQTLSGKETPMVKVPHKGFSGLYRFGSNRGYIWATTIPMLKDYIWKGAGPDCYCMVFPQNDYATRYSHSINPFFLIVDKPHDLFLQMWVNTGFFSMVVWLLMVAVYYVRVLKKGFRFDCFEGFVQAGCFLGISGFLGCALFNDGSPSTMPLFYTVLGIGFALTYFTEFTMIKEKAEKPAKKAATAAATAGAGTSTETAAPADAVLKADVAPALSAAAALKAAAAEAADALQVAPSTLAEAAEPASNTNETEAVNG
jgi:hypothetical protein